MDQAFKQGGIMALHFFLAKYKGRIWSDQFNEIVDDWEAKCEKEIERNDLITPMRICIRLNN